MGTFSEVRVKTRRKRPSVWLFSRVRAPQELALPDLLSLFPSDHVSTVWSGLVNLELMDDLKSVG